MQQLNLENEVKSRLAEQKKLLNYWRAAIKNEQILGIKINNDQYNDYFLSKEEVEDKGISAEKSRKLFEKHKKFLVQIKCESINVENKIIKEVQEKIVVLPIVIAPFIYKRKHEQGWYKNSQKKTYIHPVWIYAYLGKDGDIFSEYPCLLPPWISREYLSPSYRQGESIIIGDMSKYDGFLDQNNINSLYNYDDIEGTRKHLVWQDLYDYSKKIIKEVSPELDDCLCQNGYISQQIDNILIIPVNDNKNKNYSTMLLKLLDNLATTNEEFKPLFSRYLNLKQPSFQKVLSVEEQLECIAFNHLGQMTGDFPLAQSQRIALHHLLLMPEGEILAINGPPGTGKTTLLGSIIASLWVKAAIKKEFPPIVVVSSTNNRAIQNVIDSLENKILEHTKFGTTMQEFLGKRWINGVTSFGLYLTNNPKGSYQYYSENNQSGTLQSIENSNYVQIKDYYLENFNKCFGLNVFSIQETADFLHDKITKLELSLQSILKIATRYRNIIKKYPRYSQESVLVSKLNNLKNRLENLNIGLNKLHKFKEKWEIFLAKSIWYKLITILLPFLKNLLENLWAQKIENFLLNQKIAIEPQQRVVANYLKRQINYHCSQIKRIKFLINSYEIHLKNICCVKSEWEHLKQQQNLNNIDLETIFDFNSVENNNEQNILIFLDTKIRFLLFQHAVHYWEARWILEAIKKIKQSEKNKFDRRSKLNNFKHMAMLAPCFITTMQSGPGFFTFKMTNDQSSEFMLNSIDLLIVDEASQVHPGYGAGMMALAKKACVVGDILQLPPIVNIPGAVDIGNMKHYNLINNDEEYYDISKCGANISYCSRHGAGSVMKLAKNSSFFQGSILTPTLKEKGLFLTEHRRCVPGIISYCNEYFYENKMSYHRTPNKNHPFAPIGYAHISGLQKTVGSSKINNTEAMSIVKWISDKKEVFFKLYPGKSLDQIFGIITPFNAQANVIKSFLGEYGLLFEANNIGTIHTFQGGEFPIIIFSSVYSYQSDQKSRKLFFDTEDTMLNVAVSRARDHFFVFGDIEVFDPKEVNTPSGFLANYLLAKPENEILDVKTLHQFYKNNQNIVVKHVNSLEEHRGLLKQAFYIAKKRVFLVSPWITYNALVADNIELLIKSAVSRGVEVIIYTDINNMKCLESIEILERSGAAVRIVKNIHAKTLFVDSQLFIEGSFNWLSASRTNPNYEASVCCEGKNLEYIINNFMKRLENRELISVSKVTEA